MKATATSVEKEIRIFFFQKDGFSNWQEKSADLNLVKNIGAILEKVMKISFWTD